MPLHFSKGKEYSHTQALQKLASHIHTHAQSREIRRHHCIFEPFLGLDMSFGEGAEGLREPIQVCSCGEAGDLVDEVVGYCGAVVEEDFV
jgi:hypothetical protein